MGSGEFFLGDVISINILATILLIILIVFLCYSVKEPSAVNMSMTTLKVKIAYMFILGFVFAAT